MGRKLNKISDEIAVETLPRDLVSLKRLSMRGALSERSRDLESHAHALGGLSFDIGLTLYQQEGASDEIRKYMKAAAEYFFQEHELRSLPAENECRNPWSFKTLIEIVVCWSEAERQRLVRLQPSQYRNPCHQETECLAQYLLLLTAFVTSPKTDVERYLAFEQRISLNAKASKDELQTLLPGIQGLRALVEGNPKNLNTEIAALVKAHEQEAQKGEYKLSTEGFICLPGLALAQLGLDRGLACDVQSAYLPLELLDGFAGPGQRSYGGNGFAIYVVDEKVLTIPQPSTSDRQKYEALVAEIKTHGVRRAGVILSFIEFSRALEHIDNEMGDTDFLPVLASNNSPHNVLGSDADCPCFGYFNPEQTVDLDECLDSVAPAIDSHLKKTDDAAVKSVLHALQTVSKEAAMKGYAVAILHDEFIDVGIANERIHLPHAENSSKPAKRKWWNLMG
jgi:Immunity protein 49